MNDNAGSWVKLTLSGILGAEDTTNFYYNIFRQFYKDKVAAFRKILAEVAKEHNLPLLDMYTPTEHLDNKPSYFRPDNVHLSPRGFGLLARLVLQEMGK